MKKIVVFIFLFMLIPMGYVKADELNLAENAKSAIIVEASSGKILWEKNAHEKLAPASMTKIMSMLLIMENIESGNLSWDEKITASLNASSMGGSQIFLEPGEKMTVKDLLKGIAIGSGNDATVAMAERIAGTESKFVEMMNSKAKELGLKNTNFKDSTGLDAENHYSSAYDMAIMAKELIKHEKILEFTSTYEDYLRQDTGNSFWLVNTNKLVRYYQGLDGLKTGFTNTAGYCLTATAKRGDMRLITVVMNEPSSEIRSKETSSMLDYGFNTYEINKVLTKDSVVGNVKVSLGTKKSVDIVPIDDIDILRSKIGDKKDITYEVTANNVKAPIKKGADVGDIIVYEDGKEIMKIDATVINDVSKVNIFVAYLRNIINIISGKVF